MVHAEFRFCAVFALLLTVAVAAHARTWHVPDDAPTIQAGIDSALVGDVVELAAGTYHEIDLQMKPGITLRGGAGDADAVIIDGQNKGRIMTVTTLDAVDPTRIAHLTFAHADSGALTCRSVHDLTIEHCIFRQNACGWQAAGGLSVFGGGTGVVVRDCWFEENSGGGEGGAIRLRNFDTIKIQRCVFLRNHAEGWGAAVAVAYTGEPGLVLDQCTLVHNTGSGHGTGVLKVGWGNLEMRRSIMAFNDLVEVTSGPDHLGMAAAYCSNLYANWEPGLVLAPQGRGEPNLQVDPCFCDLDADDLHLSADSWCLPGVGPAVCLERMGALGEGCAAMGCQESPVHERSWSAVKDLFR